MSDALTCTASWNIDWISLMTGASGEPSSAASAWMSTSVFTELLVELLRERHDLVGAPVDEIHRLQQRGLFRERETDRLAEQARELVEREEIGRIRHADEVAALVFFEHERAMPARVRLGQLGHDLRIEAHLREIDEWDVEIRGEAAVQVGFRHRADVDQHAAELAAAHALLGERVLELLLGNQLLLEKQIAEADAFPLLGHGCGLSAPGRPTTSGRKAPGRTTPDPSTLDLWTPDLWTPRQTTY